MSNTISPTREMLKSTVKWTVIISLALLAWIALSAILDKVII